MKAYITNKPGKIENFNRTDVTKPDLKPGELLVKIKAASVNPADLKIVESKSGANFIHSMRPPVMAGYDFSGVVEEAGNETSQFKKGDNVFGFLFFSSKTKQGSFAEYVVVTEDMVALKPESLSFEDAAASGTTGLTALQSLVDIADIQPGKIVLINGASGGVGSYAVQIAKILGAEVWGTCSEKNMGYVKELGADNIIDYKKTILIDIGQKFDIVFDVVSNSSFAEAKKIMAKGAVYITLLPSFNFITGMISSFFTSKKCKACIVKPKKKDLEIVAQMFEEGKLKSVISSTWSMDQLPEALQEFSKGIKGKMVIVA